MQEIYNTIVLPKIYTAKGSTAQITAEELGGDIPLLFLLLHYLKRKKHLDVILHKDTITINLK